MKAKVKLHLEQSDYNLYLEIKLKVEGELLYWHSKVVVGHSFINGGGYKSDEEFFSEVIEFVSDIKNTEKAGEELLRKVIKDRAKTLVSNSKEKEAKELLKTLSRPVQIEVK